MSKRRGGCENEIGGLIESSPYRVLARGIDRLDRKLQSLLSCQDGVTKPMHFALTDAELEAIAYAAQVLKIAPKYMYSRSDMDQRAETLRAVLRRIEIIR